MAHVFQAQRLYDLREATGFISGNDLHELFRELCEGEPSPSGYTPVEIPEGHWVIRVIAEETNNLEAGVEKYFGKETEGFSDMLERAKIAAQQILESAPKATITGWWIGKLNVEKLLEGKPLEECISMLVETPELSVFLALSVRVKELYEVSALKQAQANRGKGEEIRFEAEKGLAFIVRASV
jgi:hypothetical protein